jgi:hypothetical protein
MAVELVGSPSPCERMDGNDRSAGNGGKLPCCGSPQGVESS